MAWYKNLNYDTALGRYFGKANAEKVKEVIAYVGDPAVDGALNPLRPIDKRTYNALPESKDNYDEAQKVVSGLASDIGADVMLRGSGKAAKKVAGAAAGWSKLPGPVKSTVGAVVGLTTLLSNMPKSTISKELLKELPIAAGKGTIAHVNKLDESGEEQEAARVGAVNGITEWIGDTAADVMDFGNTKKGKAAKWTLKTLLDIGFNKAQDMYESRNDGETWLDP